MKKLLTICCVLMIFLACKKPFETPGADLDDTVLVVEGNIAVGENASNLFKLSRLRPLESSAGAAAENNASFRIVSANGNSWTIPQNGIGTYGSLLSLPENDQYKLMIQTSGGDQYETSFQQAIITPPIDSLTWEQPQDLSVYVHTHDPANATRYYRWEFEETWEYNAWYEATLDFKNGVIVSRPVEEQVYTCWRNDSTKFINIGTSSTLTDDIISYHPVTTVDQQNSLGKQKLTVRYSILVHQTGLTKEAYNFWNILKKNTELTGTLFDPQPSKMPTNIQCINQPANEVIGWVSVAKITEARIFIKHSEVPLWPVPNEAENCLRDIKSIADAEAYLKADPFYSPVTYVERTGNSMVYLTSKSCMDCTAKGGSNTKPLFW